jgi:hypothetical protein
VAAVSFVALWGSDKPGTSSLIILTAAYVPYTAVGSILVARRPRNVVGWVLIGMGWTFAVSFLPIDATAHALRTLTASPIQMAIAWLADVSVSFTFALFALLAFTFPTGRLAKGRWRWLGAVVLLLSWGTVLVAAVWPVLTVQVGGAGEVIEVPNPIGIFRGLDVGLPSQLLGTVALPLIIVASIAAIAGRYRGARGLERLQMRWLVASFGAIGLAVFAGLAIVIMLDETGEIAWVPAAAAFTVPPIAIGIAVTRYRLYEIDRLISRGLSWAVLSGLLLAVYAGAVLVLQGVLGGVTQGDTVAVAGSTLLAAALFQPLRRRIQTAVDHRFNRARYDAERTAVDFAERLRGEVDIDHLQSALAATAGGAVNPDGVGVWLRPSPGVTR